MKDADTELMKVIAFHNRSFDYLLKPGKKWKYKCAEVLEYVLVEVCKTKIYEIAINHFFQLFSWRSVGNIFCGSMWPLMHSKMIILFPLLRLVRVALLLRFLSENAFLDIHVSPMKWCSVNHTAEFLKNNVGYVKSIFVPAFITWLIAEILKKPNHQADSILCFVLREKNMQALREKNQDMKGKWKYRILTLKNWGFWRAYDKSILLRFD